MTAKPYEGQKNLQAPPYIASDLQVLEHYYSLDQRKGSVPILDFFTRQRNVYLYALDLMFYSRDFFKGRLNSFPQFVVEYLKEWTVMQDFRHLLTRDIKCLAVNRVLMQSSGSLVQMVCETFKIKEDYDYFKVEIRNILHANKFKEAYYLITSLNAERDFTLQEFVFPVFFLDKEPWVKHFLSKERHSQIMFVQTLDSVCQHSKDIENFVRSLPYIGLPIRKHAYDPSRLQKLITNYLDHFDIDIKACQNLYQVRCRNAMNYLIRKRYKEDSIGKEAFLEITEAVLADNPFLQKELMMKLVCSGDTDTALKFAKIFNLSRNDWPDILQTLPVEDMTTESVPSSYSADSLQLRLHTSDVHMIDTPEKLMDVVTDIAENYDVVGMDAEWRPNLGITKENLSVFQIAVWDAVYLLDVLSLKRYPDQSFWHCVVDKILNNKNILKLGYGIRTDLQQLLSLHTGGKIEQSKLPHVLDFCEFFRKLETCYPSLMNSIKVETNPDCLPSNKGLSQLCSDLLGKPLNKDEQFSDWERRPLRRSQIVYAALDAYCLLLMYEKLFHVVQDSNLNFEDVIRKTFSSSVKVESVKKNKKQVNKKVHHKPTAVSEFKVVVDNMIHGLGKYLRLCGADVAFLDNDDDHMKSVEISNAENRIILTAGGPYQKISGYVPENMCYCVPVDVNAKAQALHVLEYFNVQCKTSDIFSRCSICSGNNFKKVPKEDLYSLWLSMVGPVEALKVGSDCNQLSNSGQKYEDRILESGVPVQVSTLTPRVFETVSFFFICVQCGKVYWEGSHFSRMKKAFSKLIEEGEASGRNIYQAAESDVQRSVQNLPMEGISKENTGPELTSPVNASKPKNYMSFNIDDGNSSDDDIDDIVYCG